jgi:hypothetical protein
MESEQGKYFAKIAGLIRTAQAVTYRAGGARPISRPGARGGARNTCPFRPSQVRVQQAPQAGWRHWSFAATLRPTAGKAGSITLNIHLSLGEVGVGRRPTATGLNPALEGEREALVEDPLRADCRDLGEVKLSVRQIPDVEHAGRVLDQELVVSLSEVVSGAHERPLRAD